MSQALPSLLSHLMAVFPLTFDAMSGCDQACWRLIQVGIFPQLLGLQCWHTLIAEEASMEIISRIPGAMVIVTTIILGATTFSLTNFCHHLAAAPLLSPIFDRRLEGALPYRSFPKKGKTNRLAES